MGRLLAGLVPELSLLVSERNGIDGEQPTKRQGILVMVLIAHVILQVPGLCRTGARNPFGSAPVLNAPPETDAS